MDTATTDELAQLATTVTIPVKPGLRTTEFWLALAVIVINHLVGALRASPSPSAQLAAASSTRSPRPPTRSRAVW